MICYQETYYMWQIYCYFYLTLCLYSHILTYQGTIAGLHFFPRAPEQFIGSVHSLENCISYLQCSSRLSASSIHPLTDTRYSLTIISVCISAYRLNPCNCSLAHSFIHSFMHSDHFYSASSSLLRSAPDTALILCGSFMPKHHRQQLRVKDLPKVSTWQLERDSNP